MSTPCAGCCDLEDCPCAKECDEGGYCSRHFYEEAARMRRHFGLHWDMTRTERIEQLERVRPLGAEGGGES